MAGDWPLTVGSHVTSYMTRGVEGEPITAGGLRAG